MMMMMQADKIERQRVTCSSLYGLNFLVRCCDFDHSCGVCDPS